MSEIIDVMETPEWDDLIVGSNGEVFGTRRWMSCLRDAFDLRFEAVVERDANGISGGIPFAHIDDVRGERVVVLPFSDFSPLPVRDSAQWASLAGRLMEYEVPIGIGAPSDSVVLTDDRFKAETSAVRQQVYLDPDPEKLFDRLSTQPLRHVRKAERAGIKFRPAENREELRAFYELHRGVRKYRHGLLCQPFDLFSAIWDRFIEAGDGTLLLGFDGETVAGGCLLLSVGETFYYKYAASHPDYRSKGASHGAVAAAMSLGLELGHRTLDLGRSDLAQQGLIDFKRRFGATASPLSRYSWKPDLYNAPDVASAEIIDGLSKLFTNSEVPDDITEQAGDLMYRLFA